MKTLFNKLMVTLMALTLVFGSTMTAFAAEDETKATRRVEGEDVVAGEQEIPVTVTYTKNIDTDNGGTDDSLRKIYCIEILYDELDFSYEATSIEWDSEHCIYKVTTSYDSSSPQTKNIEVINKSNRALNMTTKANIPDSFNSPWDYRELKSFSMNLKISDRYHHYTLFDESTAIPKIWSDYGNSLKYTTQLDWGAYHGYYDDPLVDSAFAEIEVSMHGLGKEYYANSINTFENIQVAKISLSFADSEPAEETVTD